MPAVSAAPTLSQIQAWDTEHPSQAAALGEDDTDALP